MKFFLPSVSIGILLFSCSKKDDNSFVPIVTNTTAQTSVTAETVATTVAKPELKKDGDMSLPGYNLINNSDCLSCHKSSVRLIGPSYKEIAKKYTEKDADMLAEKIVKGGKGVWGEVAMAPHPQISNDDAKKMVAYIMTLKK